jgi:hypothetical protein
MYLSWSRYGLVVTRSWYFVTWYLVISAAAASSGRKVR